MTQKQTQAATVLSYMEVTSPIGPLILVSTLQGLCKVDFGTYEQNREKLQQWANRWFGSMSCKRMPHGSNRSYSSWSSILEEKMSDRV